MISKCLFFLPVILTFSCATAYQPVSYTGGYADREASKNLYLVCFQGNGYSFLSGVKKNMFRRCSELCKEKGFNGYKVIDGPRENSLVTNVDDLNDYGDRIPEDVVCPGNIGRFIASPAASVLIRCQNSK